MHIKFKSIFLAILVTFLLLGAIYLLNLFIDAQEKSTNTLRNICIITIYVSAILLYKFLNKHQGLVQSNNPGIRNIILILILTFMLFLGIYSIQIILSFFVLGESFKLELITYYRSLYTAILAVLIIPLLEEVLFRESILRNLYTQYSAISSLTISAFLFALSHWWADTGLFWIFVMGVFIGYIYLVFKSLLLAFLVHAFYNLLTLFLGTFIYKFLYALSMNEIYQYLITILVITSLSFWILIHKLKPGLNG